MRLIKARTRWPELFPIREGDVFDDLFRQMTNLPTRTLTPEMVGWYPLVELVDTDDELVLTAELPGVDRDDVDIKLEDNILMLRGEKKEEVEKNEKKYHLWERTYGAFERIFTLPHKVDPDRIHAEFRNGILMVRLPKMQEARGRKIEITAGA